MFLIFLLNSFMLINYFDGTLIRRNNYLRTPHNIPMRSSSDAPVLSHNSSIDFGNVSLYYIHSKSFCIWNSGNGTLEYTLNKSTDWIISITPSEGNCTSEYDNITISIRFDDFDDMGMGFETNITICSNGGNSSIKVLVNNVISRVNAPLFNLILVIVVIVFVVGVIIYSCWSSKKKRK